MELAELEAIKERLPDRVYNLEKRVDSLHSLLRNSVDTAIMVCLEHAGLSRVDAKEYSD